jgi:hypothetical protein
MPLYHGQIGTFVLVHPKLPSSEIQQSKLVLVSPTQSIGSHKNTSLSNVSKALTLVA